MLSHELWHLLFATSKGLIVSSPILQFHIYYVRLLLGWLHCRVSSPILVSLIVCSWAYKARVVHFKEIILNLGSLSGLYLKRFEFSLISWCEISMHFVREFQIQPLSIKIEYWRFGFGVKLAVVYFVVCFHVVRVLVEQVLFLRFHALTTWYASVLLSLQVLVQISFEEFLCVKHSKLVSMWSMWVLMWSSG